MIKLAILLASILSATAAQADWLDHAWREDAVNPGGRPAVTLTADGVVLVLPNGTLDEAREAGVSTQDAVRMFIERYRQPCSDVVDLNRPQPKLKVRLLVSRWVPFEGASSRVQDDVFSGTGAAKEAELPHRKSLFVVDEAYTDYVIDYAPTWRAACVRAGEATAEGSTN